jgi:hypothetical protein
LALSDLRLFASPVLLFYIFIEVDADADAGGKRPFKLCRPLLLDF